MIDLTKWLLYIENEVGFILPKSQHNWLSNAIIKTAKKNKLTENELWQKLQTDNADLRQQLFNAVMIAETRFFRHPPSIEFITQKGYEHSLKFIAGSQVFRVLSMGCSQGHEVWSIIMSLAHKRVKYFCVTGTDISTKSIKVAKKAKYTLRSKTEIPEEFHKFVQMPEDKGRKWQVDKQLFDHVTFKQHNLFLEEPVLAHQQDIIVCQNTLIYFRKFDQRDILSRFVKQCKLGGYIVLAPGEGMFWQHPKMEKVDNSNVNAWKKIRD